MRAIRRVRLFGVFALVVAMALLAAWYFTFTSERERYLTSRNVRLLTTIATQVDSTIAAQERMFRTFLGSSDGTAWFAEARTEVPTLRFVDETRLPAGVKPFSAAMLTPQSRISVEGRNVWLRLTFTPKNGNSTGTRDVWLALDRLLAPIFDPLLLDRAFGTLVLATGDGQVLHAMGERSAELMLTRLDALGSPPSTTFSLSTKQAESNPSRSFRTIGATTGLLDVVISGTEYRLFSQPCCLMTPVQSGLGPAASTPSASSLVIVGLVNASEFRSKTREFSPVVVIVCIALIMLALAGWPFLKISLLGERQRARRRDVIAVVAFGIFGIALLTVVFVDLYASRQLNSARDRQLEQFADRLSEAVQGELSAAHRQLRCLAEVALRPRPKHSVLLTSTEIFDESFRRKLNGPDNCLANPSYPFIETFALIDRSGLQRVKWTPQQWLPEPISVAARAYYTEVAAGGSWHLASCPGGCFLESIWSWTTTRPEAVVSMPTSRNEFPVAAIATPMLSLIRPVVPDGFEFAVIDEDGLVLFHSDPQRNTYENLFQETDQNRRLRAAVAGHSAETFDLPYAGRSYRARVDRLGVGDWSVVTLHSKEPTWALHIEWLVITMAALVTYTLSLTGLLALCLWTRRADWLWSDSPRVSRYKKLSLLILVLLIAGTLSLFFVRGGTLILLVFSLPLVGWFTSYMVLQRQPHELHGSVRVHDAYAAYASLAVLLFLLTGVIPAAGFLTAAYDVQARTYVKHTQLKLAQAYRDRSVRVDREHGHGRPVAAAANEPWDVHYRFLFDSTLDSPRVAPQTRSWFDDVEAYTDMLFVSFLEEYLPYYSERSVQIRELLHDEADDGAWSWNAAGSTLELRLFGVGDQKDVVVTSVAPRLWEAVTSGESLGAGVWIILTGMVLAGLTWAIVRFIETHICLIGVDQPIWSKVKLAGSSGDNLFVVCDPGARAGFADGTVPLSLQEISNSPTPDKEWVRKLMDIDRLEPLGRPLLLADFDERLDDSELTYRKLNWLEELAHDQTRSVIVLSSASPSMLGHTLRKRHQEGTTGDAALLERWRAVIGSFVVINWRDPDDRSSRSQLQRESLTGWLASLPGHAWQLVTAIRQRTLWKWLNGMLTSRKDMAARRALTAEAEADAFVRAICKSIEERLDAGTLRLSRDQVLDEVTERTATWYRRLWKACTPDEQLVLAEIAHEGFVNYKSRRTVRRLLGRGLIAKDPSFRLMNETFRRFVLSPPCQADVRAIEGAADPSPWDELRMPFFVVLGGAALFFMYTQRELFDATIAALTTLTMAIPVVIRAVGFMAGKRIDVTDVQKV
jgi:hypothetical protein